MHYVLDGGALLQRVPWTNGETFENICLKYVSYVTNRYGKATIVFDGYDDAPSIKDALEIAKDQMWHSQPTPH